MAKRKVIVKKTIHIIEENKPVNWLLVLLMSIFFGYLGVDRFIMGHVGWGILKLITLGGLGLWWLIDIILVATKYQYSGVEWVDHTV